MSFFLFASFFFIFNSILLVIRFHYLIFSLSFFNIFLFISLFLRFIRSSIVPYIRPLSFLMYVLIFQSCLVHSDNAITVDASFRLSAVSLVNKLHNIHVLIADTQQSVSSSRLERPLSNESCPLYRPLKRVRHICYVAVNSYSSVTTRENTFLTLFCAL